MSILTDAVNFSQSMIYEELPNEVIEISKRALIDYIGVTLAGSKEPVSRSIQAYVKWATARSESRVFGTDMTASYDLAPLANGVAGHSLDYDDTS